MADSGNPYQLLMDKLDALQRDMETLKSKLEAPAAGSDRLARIEQLLNNALHSSPKPPHTVHNLNIFFDKKHSERKPYILKTDGILSTTQKLSLIRTAIVLVLLLDLQDRCEKGPGVRDPLDAISRAAAILQGGSTSEETSAENVRVALYRVEQFFQAEKEFSNSDVRLWFDAQNIRLVVFDKRTQKAVEGLVVQVTTNDEPVAAVINQILAQSPIARARKRRALYVPAGPEGSDRLLLEMYDHNFPLRVTSMYVRPPFQSYPISLLEYMGIPELVIRRKRIAFEGYKSGRCNFVEILAEKTIWDLIRWSPEHGFKLYPKAVRTEHVIEHFDNLIYILNSFENYNLHLTGAAIPFAMVTYEIKSGVIPEYFTVFFQAFTSAASRDLGCFALCDPLAYQSIHENIIDWIAAHPTTIRDRAEVVRRLSEVRTHLAENGPLPLVDDD